MPFMSKYGQRGTVAYRKNSWFPMPRALAQKFTTLSHPALKLYIALTLQERGRVRQITIPNQELMAAAAITREKTFRASRTELIEAGLVENVEATDPSGRVYQYRIVDATVLPEELKPAKPTDPNEVQPIPRHLLHSVLSPAPMLGGHNERGRRALNARDDGH